MIQYAAPSGSFPSDSEYWMPGFAGMTARGSGDFAYLNAEKRLSNELAGTIGAEPATTPSFAGAANAAAACESETDGFTGGWAAACLISGLISAAFGAAAAFEAGASERGGPFPLASRTFGFAGIRCPPAVVSARPPTPALAARAGENPSGRASCGA